MLQSFEVINYISPKAFSFKVATSSSGLGKWNNVYGNFPVNDQFHWL